MNNTPKNTSKVQPSILDFVDSPNYSTAKNREPHLLKKTLTPQQHGSSSNSSNRKCKLSLSEPTEQASKILIMEPSDSIENNSKDSSSAPIQPKAADPYTTALLEMEMHLTQSMQDMIAPLKSSINSLVVRQQDWEQQKADVKILHTEKE